jgi:hypothetical protein
LEKRRRGPGKIDYNCLSSYITRILVLGKGGSFVPRENLELRLLLLPLQGFRVDDQNKIGYNDAVERERERRGRRRSRRRRGEG